MAAPLYTAVRGGRLENEQIKTCAVDSCSLKFNLKLKSEIGATTSTSCCYWLKISKKRLVPGTVATAIKLILGTSFFWIALLLPSCTDATPKAATDILKSQGKKSLGVTTHKYLKIRRTVNFVNLEILVNLVNLVKLIKLRKRR